VEEGEGDAVLLDGEVGLALGFRADGDEKCAALAEVSVEVAPGFELGDAVGAPAATEELDDEGAHGEEVCGADEAVGGVAELERGEGGAGGEDAVFDAGEEEFFDGAFADGEAVGWDEGAGARGDGVEVVLEGGERVGRKVHEGVQL